MADIINDAQSRSGLRKTRRTQPTTTTNENEQLFKATPLKRYSEAISTQTPNKVLQEFNQTPRRSVRISVKTRNYSKDTVSKVYSAQKSREPVSEVRGRKKQRNVKDVAKSLNDEMFEEPAEAHDNIENDKFENKGKVTQDQIEEIEEEKKEIIVASQKNNAEDEEKSIEQQPNLDQIIEKTELENKDEVTLKQLEEIELSNKKIILASKEKNAEDKEESIEQQPNTDQIIENTEVEDRDDITLKQLDDIEASDQKIILASKAKKAEDKADCIEPQPNLNKPLEKINTLKTYENILEEENLAELGLKPLEPEIDEEEVFVINENAKAKFNGMEQENCEQVIKNVETETAQKNDMDTLIYCDDDESLDHVNNEEDDKNDTFNMSDCIIISPAIEEKVTPSNDIDIQNSKPEIEKSTKTPIKQSEITIAAGTSPMGTSLSKKEKRKMPKHPTPYKPKKQRQLRQDKHNESKLETENSVEQSKNVILQGIRKRSKTMDNDINKKTKNNVTFYSPANQTVIIEAVDICTPTFTNDNNIELPEEKKPDEKAHFITQRRRRSMSLDENLLDNLNNTAVTNSNTKLEATPNKSKSTRTKLPNFAAIHQKQFSKMENLVDHVARKAERAKVLITSSAGKTRPASAQKSHGAGRLDNSRMNDIEKLKASRKIELPMVEQIPQVEEEEIRIPIIRPPLTTRSPRVPLKKAASVERSTGTKPKPHLTKRLKAETTKPLIKKAFNLSTQLPKSTFALNSTANFANLTSSTTLGSVLNETKSKDNVSVVDKSAARRQRHMDMFKGRRGRLAADSKDNSMQRKQELIRGVRSNRRFELQMQHRRNLEN